VSPLNLAGPEFLALFAGASIVASLTGLAIARILSPSKPPGPALLTEARDAPYLIAATTGGTDGVLSTALARMLHTGKLTVANRTIIPAPAPEPLDSVEAAILDALDDDTSPRAVLL
ncbi:unnamed protein product, partial [Ectocarpus fasciculatus]